VGEQGVEAQQLAEARVLPQKTVEDTVVAEAGRVREAEGDGTTPQLLRHLLQHLHLHQLRSMEATQAMEAMEASQAVVEGARAGSKEEEEAEGTRVHMGNTCLTC
jgi:hypothetical protein